MRTARRVLAAAAASAVALVIVAGAAARTPAALETHAYPWVQLPAQVGATIPLLRVVPTGGTCVQPPASIAVCAPATAFRASTGYPWAQPPALGGTVPVATAYDWTQPPASIFIP